MFQRCDAGDGVLAGEVLWELPWPRQGLCMPQASAQAAVGVRRPLPQGPSTDADRRAGAISVERSLWQGPRPRQGLRMPQASAQAAVGVRRPLPQNPSTGADRRAGAISVGASIVGATLAATRPVHAASFGTGRCRGQKTPPTEPHHRRRSPSGRDLFRSKHCGSGLGRDRACACRKLQHRPLSGSEDPSYRTPPPAPSANAGRPYILQLTATQAARSGIG